MLKHAIDFYNHLLDIIDIFKSPSRRTKSVFFSSALIALLAGSWLSVQALGGVSAADQQIQQIVGGQALPLDQQAGQSESSVNTSVPSTSTKAVVSSDSKPTDSADDKKTPAKADTPPTADSQDATTSKSFSVAVTADSQFDPGTVVGYDAVKQQADYYGGKLTPSITAVTISKSAKTADPISLSFTTADGTLVGVPTQASADTISSLTLTPLSSQSTTSSSTYAMQLGSYSQLEKGTYHLHVTASRSVSATKDKPAGLWWYHGFITISVVD